MRLHHSRFHVERAEFGRQTRLLGRALTIDPSEIQALAGGSSKVTAVTVDLVRPGESARIVNALDVIEPRVKTSGGRIFPGFLGSPVTVGSGATCSLGGVNVVTVGVLPASEAAIIDMGGPGAAYTPYSASVNLVLSFTQADGTPWAEFDDAVRRAGLQVAERLAQAALDLPPDEEDELNTDRSAQGGGLPRVVCIQQLMMVRTFNQFVYGRSFDNSLPALLDANELFDGAVVSGDHHFACQRIPTYAWQHHGLATTLRSRHGKDLEFLGVILTRSSSLEHFDKERFANYVAQLASLLQADAAVIAQHGGGHGVTDLMMVCHCCEQRGIKTVMTINEMGGADGRAFPLVDFMPEARSIVSCGNRDEVVVLPPVSKLIGGPVSKEINRPADQELAVPVMHIFSATDQTGLMALGAVDF